MTSSARRRLILGSLALSGALAAASLILLALSASEPAGVYGFRGGAALFTVTYAGTGSLIALRRPDHPVGWLFLAIGLLSGVQAVAQEYAAYALLARDGELPGGLIGAWMDNWIWVPLTGATGIHAFLLLPDGRLPSRRWRVVAVVGAVVIVLTSLALMFYPVLDSEVVEGPNPFGLGSVVGLLDAVLGVGFLLFMASMAAAALSVVLRYRRARGEERRQLRWIALSAVLVGFSFLGNAIDAGARIVGVAVMISFATVPTAIGIGILRHRLFDIDVAVNRAVVFGTLAAFITAVYVGIVVGIGSLLGAGDEPNVALSIAATAVLAVAFQPVRRRVQGFANRLVYGERATPYEVMAGFSHRMAAGLSVDEVLPRMAQAAAEGVGAARGRVRLILPLGGEHSVVWPAGTEDGDFERAFAVVHRGETVGEIAVAKPPGEPLTPGEDGLLRDLAAQAGLALHNVRLTEELEARLEQLVALAHELRASRQRIVAAQDAERSRLERDIRSGAERQLSDMAAMLAEAESLLAESPAAAEALLAEVGGMGDRALQGLRDLARGIYPPLLATGGLVAALQAHVRKAAFTAGLRVDPSLEGARFDPKTEAAAYFCCLEALDNAARYAPGSAVEISARAGDGWLSFTVSDRGPGFDPSAADELSGLQRMRDRVEALGGSLAVRSGPEGTVVEGRVPVGEPAQPAPAAAVQASSSRSGPNADLGM